MGPKLSKSAEAVLRFLYDHRDGDAPNVEAIASATALPASEVEEVLTTLKERGFVQGPPSLLERCALALTGADFGYSPAHEDWPVGIVVIAANVVGPKENLIASKLGYDREFVAVVGKRMRDAGFWTDDAVESPSDTLVLGLQIAVGSGGLTSKIEKGERLYSATPYGLKRAEKLIKRREP